MALVKDYPAYHKHLQELMGKLGQEHPEVMKAFGSLHAAATAEGELDSATKAAIVETIGVAILMGGGPSVMYGVEALEAVAQFEAELS